MLRHLLKFTLLTSATLLIAASPVIGAVGHECLVSHESHEGHAHHHDAEGHEHSSHDAASGHDKCCCDCMCHAPIVGIIMTTHDMHVVQAVTASSFHNIPTLSPYFSSLDRPPRLHS